MSHDESPNVPAPRDRREAVREKAIQVKARQSRARVVRAAVLGVGAIAVVGAAAAAVTWALTSSNRPQLQPAAAEQDGFSVTDVTGSTAVRMEVPATPVPTEAAAPETTETMEAVEAAPTVDIRIYVDYLSTGAREFQLANSAQLSRWVDEDAVSLSYYPVAMLTAKSNGTKYSLRAASAAACVATHSPDAFYAFHDALLRQQPAVDSDGLSDEELATLARAAGVSPAKTVDSCIIGEEFAAWAKAATDRALDGLPGTDDVSLTGTPMVLVNGVPYVGALDDPKEFAQFVMTTDSDAYYTTPSPTPVPTDTATPAP